MKDLPRNLVKGVFYWSISGKSCLHFYVSQKLLYRNVFRAWDMNTCTKKYFSMSTLSEIRI